MGKLVGERAARLVERQMTMFHAQQRAAREAPTGPPRAAVAVAEPVAAAPYIAISRQYGARGSEVARLLAGNLGWTLYDRELLEAIAQDAHLHGRLLEPFDETARNDIEEWIRGLMDDGTVSHHHFSRALLSVLASLATVGRAVIVGRGAHLVLPPATGLRVRIYAPLEARIEAICADEGLDAAAARRKIDQVETARQHWLHRAFGDRVKEPFAFDLALNTGALSVDACVELALLALKAKCG